MKYESIIIILAFILVFGLTYHFISLTKGHSYSHGMENLEEKNVYPEDENIDFYVITLKNPERMKNIDEQMEKLKDQGTPVQIQIVDGVVGVDLNLNELAEQKKLCPEYKDRTGYKEMVKKKEIGCYMSHLKIYDIIKEKGNSGYSIIFEDDFKISSDHFLKDVYSSLNYLKEHNLDFDVLYLGTHTENHGELINDKTYKIDKGKDLYGTHAMLINHKNIDKIIENLKFIKVPIDVEYTQLCRSDKINADVIFPHIVNQQNEKLTSTIQTENFQQLTKSFQFSNFEI